MLIFKTGRFDNLKNSGAMSAVCARRYSFICAKVQVGIHC